MVDALRVAFTATVIAGCGASEPACSEPACPAVAPLSAGGEALAFTVDAGSSSAATSTFRITAIDSGQGDCALIECPNGTNVMVDCGSSRNAHSSREHVREVLSQRIGDAAIDVLVLTHPDRDHYNWVPAVLDGREVRRLVHAAALPDYDVGDTDAWLEGHVQANERHGLGPNHHDAVNHPTEWIDCGDVEAHILAANVPSEGSHASSHSWQSNTASIVLRFGLHGAPRAMAILTGDATWYTERSIRQAYASDDGAFLRADLLRLGHHGTGVTSSEASWLDAVEPRVAFSSAGHYGGGLRHPRCDVVDRALDSAPLAATQCHELECGIIESGDGATDPSTCGSSGDGWCAFATEYALFDTHASGDLTFTFIDGWLEEPQFTRGETECMLEPGH